MNTLVKSVLVVIGLFGLIGLRNYSLANQKQKTVAVIPRSSIMQIAEISDGDGEKKDDNGQEMIKLKSLAKITPKQAQKLAETSRGGRASTVKLETENKSLVYSVMIGSDEITIDAGNGKVLCTNSQNNEKNEINCPRGSIQVSTIGDGDGETNDDKLK